jgi:archaellum biogenesis ATPase FlaH
MTDTVEDLQAHRARRTSKLPKDWLPPHVTEAEIFIGKKAPKRVYLDPDSKLLPMRQVILFQGDGGTGKSLLALQLALACSSVLPDWIGCTVEHGPVIYLSAEDAIDEIHKRMEEVCEAAGADLEMVRGRLSIIAMADQDMDAVLAKERKDKNGIMEPTPLYHWLDGLMEERSPMLLILDNIADTFAGNENNRVSVKQFVNLLRRLAIKHDCVILLLGHPSKEGRKTKTGESGSTGWNNSVRVRLYLHTVTVGEGDNEIEPDEDVRELEVMKSNYTRKGRKIRLRWKDGRFVPDQVAARSYYDGVPSEFYKQVQAAFIGQRYRASNQSPEWGGFKVAEMLDWDVGIGLKGKQVSGEQQGNRDKIAKLLADMVKSKAIRVTKDKDGHSDTRPYFEAGGD